MKERKLVTPRKKAAIVSDQAIPLAIAFPAPAGLGRQCDAVYASPLCEDNPSTGSDTPTAGAQASGGGPDAPRLRHCCHTATRRMVLRSDHRAQAVKRCDRHAQSLRLRVATGLAYFTIEADEPIGAVRCKL